MTYEITTASPDVLHAADYILKVYERCMADRVLSLDDPRIPAIIATDAYPFEDGGERLAEYFGDTERTVEHIVFRYLTDRPTPPIPVPAWADRTRLLFDDFPDELGFEFSTRVTAAGITVGVDCIATLMLTDSRDPEGRMFERGTIYTDKTLRGFVEHGTQGFDFEVHDPADLDVLGTALTDLADRLHTRTRELHRTTGPGQPAAEDLAGVGL